MVTAIVGFLVGFVLALWVALVLSNAELDAAHRRADQAEAERDRLTTRNTALEATCARAYQAIRPAVTDQLAVEELIRSTGGRP